MATTEVTFDVYDIFTREESARRHSDFGYGRGKLPAVDMVWLDAVRFCNWLSGKDGVKPAYKIDGEQVTWIRSSEGYRLPTEAEWVYAAHGGPLAESFLDTGSDNADEVAWYRNNSGFKNHPVGLKEPNGLGLFDMSGNVEEYCWDWADGRYGASGPVAVDPVGPNTRTMRAVRGGSHVTGRLMLAIWARAGAFSSIRSGIKGFRVVRTAPAAK